MKIIWAVILALLASTGFVFLTGGETAVSGRTTATSSTSPDASSAANAAGRSISMRRPASRQAEPAPRPAPGAESQSAPTAETAAEPDDAGTPARDAAAPIDAAANTPANAPAEVDSAGAAPAETADVARSAPDAAAEQRTEPAPPADEPDRSAASAIFERSEPAFVEDDTAPRTTEAEDAGAAGDEPAQVKAALTNPDDSIGSFVTGSDGSAEPADAPDEGTPSAEDVAALFSGGSDGSGDTANADASRDAAAPADGATLDTAEAADDTEAAGAYTLEGGTLEIEGGRWTIEGSGTEADPYVVPWDLLDAAQDSYEPRLDKDTIPAWARYLDGKTVAIAGYLLMPMGGGTAKDLLAMRNQWDGCCIGTPPTPYSAVEVTLAQPIDTFSSSTATRYGTVEGTFRVDPYLASGWLLGLYILENASVQGSRPADVP